MCFLNFNRRHSNCYLREALSVLYQVNWVPRAINNRDKNAGLKCEASLMFKNRTVTSCFKNSKNSVFKSSTLRCVSYILMEVKMKCMMICFKFSMCFNDRKYHNGVYQRSTELLSNMLHHQLYCGRIKTSLHTRMEFQLQSEPG